MVSETWNAGDGLILRPPAKSIKLNAIGIRIPNQSRDFNNGKLARIRADYAHAAALAAHGAGKKKRQYYWIGKR